MGVFPFVRRTGVNDEAARAAVEKVAEEMIGNGQKMIEAGKTVG
ncbi:MAG: hypothetical protein WA005_17005 [Candidatus Binataceae bacterium]